MADDAPPPKPAPPPPAPSPAPAPAPAPAGGDEPVTRAELEEAVRFVHVMSMQTKLSVERVDSLLGALAAALVKANVVDESAMNAGLPEAQKQARERNIEAAHVRVGPAHDKYEVASPDIDCAALIPICQARCCRLSVHLAFQDIDEGLRWEYARPYELRRRESDGYCIYSDTETRGCGVYTKRPSVCRSYDCRNDQRIWLNFEERIPAPLERSDPPLYAIRRAKRQP
jgi:Putative zinc- or iron-chelating domain